MDLLIAAVGTRMPNWVDEAFAEYQKRMPREARIRLLEIKPDKRDCGKTAQQVMSTEAVRIEDALPKDCIRIVLDEHGKSLTSQALAKKMQVWLGSGRNVALLIGGGDGLAPGTKGSAHLIWG